MFGWCHDKYGQLQSRQEIFGTVCTHNPQILPPQCRIFRHSLFFPALNNGFTQTRVFRAWWARVVTDFYRSVTSGFLWVVMLHFVAVLDVRISSCVFRTKRRWCLVIVSKAISLAPASKVSEASRFAIVQPHTKCYFWPREILHFLQSEQHD